jgi:hypothetical protein
MQPGLLRIAIQHERSSTGCGPGDQSDEINTPCEDEMNAYNVEDHRKHNYALLARDIRRLTAKIHRADIDDEARNVIDTALERLESRLWLMSFYDPASGVLIQDPDVYSDGRPVTTTITWGGGFARLIHSPDPNDETVSEAEELAEERWPEGSLPLTDHRGA